MIRLSEEAVWEAENPSFQEIPSALSKLGHLVTLCQCYIANRKAWTPAKACLPWWFVLKLWMQTKSSWRKFKVVLQGTHEWQKKKKTKHLFIQHTHTEQSSYYVPTELSRAGRKQRAKGSSSCVPLFSGRIFFLGISLTFLTSLWPELGPIPPLDSPMGKVYGENIL